MLNDLSSTDNIKVFAFQLLCLVCLKMHLWTHLALNLSLICCTLQKQTETLTTPTISPSELSGSNSLGGTFSKITTCPLAMVRIAQPLHPSTSLPGCPRSSVVPLCLQAVSSIKTHLIYPSLISTRTLIMGFFFFQLGREPPEGKVHLLVCW